jgi:DNA polymerase-1
MFNRLIFDGLNIFLRHYAANPSMSKSGYQIGGLVGFLSNLKELIDKFKPKETIVIWEAGGSSKRRLVDANYKNGRRPINLNRFYDPNDIPDTQENRNYQLINLINLIKCLPIKQLYVTDCEADDAIAILTKNFSLNDENTKNIIVSSDKDFYQLVNDQTIIWNPNKKTTVEVQDILDEFQIHPINFALFKSIVGDRGDNVTGVKSVGSKTVENNLQMLKENNQWAIQDCLERLEKDNKKLFDKIQSNKDLIQKNLKLVALDFGLINNQTVKKVEWLYNDKDTLGKKNKIAFYRLLNKEGINTFDVESFFMILNQIRVNND